MNSTHNSYNSITVASLAGAGLTLGMFGVCLVSMGVGHGSSLPFKLCFPIPYGLLELVKVFGDSLLTFLLFGFVQNFIYVTIFQKIKGKFSTFISLWIVIIFHLVAFIFVNNVFE